MASEIYFSPGLAPSVSAGNPVRHAWLPDCAPVVQPPGTRLRWIARLGHAVPGALVGLDQARVAELTARLGPEWTRRQVLVLDSNGEVQRAQTFEAIPPEGLELAPALPLFTYGTLMEGECRHHHLEPFGVSKVVPARVRGLLADFGEHPGMVRPLNVRGYVQGQLMWLERMPEALEVCDPVEDFKGFGVPGSWFRRTVLNAHLADNRTIPAWVYVYNGAIAGRPLISGGDWRAHVSGRR